MERAFTQMVANKRGTLGESQIQKIIPANST